MALPQSSRTAIGFVRSVSVGRYGSLPGIRIIPLVKELSVIIAISPGRVLGIVGQAWIGGNVRRERGNASLRFRSGQGPAIGAGLMIR
jgi:hypothetical protein